MNHINKKFFSHLPPPPSGTPPPRRRRIKIVLLDHLAHFYTIMNKSHQPLQLIIFFTSAFRQFSLHLFIILLCNRIEVQRYDTDEERNSRNNTG